MSGSGARSGPRAGVDPTRDAAFTLLDAVAGRRRPLDDALDALPPIDARDRAAAHRLAAATLRHEGSLDAVLARHLRREPPLPVRLVLRLGAASLLLLGGAPHAAVSTAVGLCRTRRLDPFAGLVNAVLRRVAAEGAGALDALDMPHLDTPAWLWASWGEHARRIAAAHGDEAPIDLALRPGADVPEGAERLPGGGARLPAGTRIASLAGYAEGLFWVQDLAAGLPVRLLGPCAGMRVCDLCAAPGGKTAQLVSAGATVVAVDRDGTRLGRLRENLARLRLEAETVEADALGWTPAGDGFDAVLLDAPCSATGTIRRHPDIPRLRRPRDVEALSAIQWALIERAHGLLRPGGVLVYAVCSLQAPEGRDQVARALGSGRWAREAPDRSGFAGLEHVLNAEGDVQTDPSMGMDGFQATRLRRLG